MNWIYNAVMSTVNFVWNWNESIHGASSVGDTPEQVSSTESPGPEPNPGQQPVQSTQPIHPVPDEILAFKTATLILSQLRNTQQLPYDEPDISPPESREVRIADAFAHIAVANHDIISISTHRTPSSMEVVASTTLSETGPIPNAPNAQAPIAEVPQECIVGFCATKNTNLNEHDTTMENLGPFPIVVPTIPLRTGDKTLEEYLEQLQTHWSVQIRQLSRNSSYTVL